MTKTKSVPTLTASALRHQQQSASRVAATSLKNRATGARAGAQLRRAFIVHPNHARPPLATIVGGAAGQGGGTRLKLLLSLIWHAKRDSPTVTRPAIYWARLIGLVDPEREMITDPGLSQADAEAIAIRKGKDRINASLRWLEEHDFLTRDVRKGKEPVIHLNEETLRTDGGEYVSYTSPGRVLKERLVPAEERFWHHYMTLPPHLWTSGAIARLNGAGLATLLVFLDSLPYEKAGLDPGIFWHSDDWQNHYWLSPDLRYRGLKQNEALGLIKHRSLPMGIRIPQDAPDGRYYEYYLLDAQLDGR